MQQQLQAPASPRPDLRLAAPNPAQVALIEEIEAAPGWATLTRRQGDEFRVVVQSLAQGRQIVGGWRAIATVLGLKHRQRVYERLALWRKAGLVSECAGNGYTLDPETRRATFVAGSGTWEILPEEGHGTRTLTRTLRARTRGEEASTNAPDVYPDTEPGHSARACLQSLRVEDVKDEVVDAGRDRWANDSIDALATLVGRPITGRGRQIIFGALIENPEGVRACWEQRAKHGDKPEGLLIEMLKAGEHRTRRLAAPRCLHCRAEHPSVRDRAAEFGTTGGMLLCDRCAAMCGPADDPRTVMP